MGRIMHVIDYGQYEPWWLHNPYLRTTTTTGTNVAHVHDEIHKALEQMQGAEIREAAWLNGLRATDNVHDDDPPEVETGVPELEEPENTDAEDDNTGNQHEPEDADQP
jgi:hypothetical protein